MRATCTPTTRFHSSLSLCLSLSQLCSQAATFMAPPLRGRTAFASLHFLELLVGPRCQELRVARPQRYHFDRHALLLSMAALVAQLGRRPEFPQACRQHAPGSLHACMHQQLASRAGMGHIMLRACWRAVLVAGTITVQLESPNTAPHARLALELASNSPRARLASGTRRGAGL